MTQIIVVGGVPGTGKSSVAGRLAAHMQGPLLSSDLLGDTIRTVNAEWAPSTVPSSVAFRAGYESLFALTEQFVTCRCSTVVDISLGWTFQWEALGAIQDRHPDVRLRPFILESSQQTCLHRLQQRHLSDPQRHPPAEEFMRQPQLRAVEELLRAVDRHDVHRVDAERPLAEVVQEIRRLVDAR